MNERGIGEEEARRAVRNALASGPRFLRNCKTEALATDRNGPATLWVLYSVAGECVEVVSAWSHRMVVHEGFNAESNGVCDDQGWCCGPCDLPLKPALVKLSYLDERFEVDFPACPNCQAVLVTEQVATGNMAKAEQMLEDK